MNFWIFAVALLAVPAAVIAWPFFAGDARQRMAGLGLLLLMPIAGLVLYQLVGNPAAINPPPVAAPQQHSIEEMVTQLQQRMNENPKDVQGWLLLGRSYKSMRRFVDAQTALEHANQLTPNNPLIMVEIAETRLMGMQQPAFTAEIRQLLESALAIDPSQQKGLWLLGMAAARDRDDARAIELWQKLLDQIDPSSSVASSVKQQLDQVKKRSGIQSDAGPAVAAIKIPVNIDLANGYEGSIPDQAVLFVFIRPAGGSGMPLGVKRIAAPQFPLELELSNADVLRPGTALQDFKQLTISARLSMRGVASAASGDYQANAITFSIDSIPEIALTIDQRVP